ncbi:hypothetical protein FRB91_009835 [Serendipita sp. 411]|nr:hypothetical protein FRC15_001215 [Serendipita sp. 397]KAG8828677.1 hypothetical protein FRC19_000064 [Serendipita sp. 401]KAG8849508.1 hypothetical protein FRB91_009835 [Serendipita sp. 411]KAG8865693.1 hypothetical protein FRC20_009571 [Serendipita sp. 405]KAG9058873.1 hypothetical protein FS842_000071 [Serendipita sp. 407]
MLIPLGINFGISNIVAIADLASSLAEKSVPTLLDPLMQLDIAREQWLNKPSVPSPLYQVTNTGLEEVDDSIVNKDFTIGKYSTLSKDSIISKCSTIEG